jgi:integrase
VQPSGVKSFAVRYRFNGPKKLTLGPVEMGLAAARKLAGDALFELAQGRDPGAKKREAKEAQRQAALAVEDTFYSVSEKFLQLEGPKLRSVERRRKELARLIYPKIGARSVNDLKRSEIVRLLDEIEQSSGPAMAQAVLTIIGSTLSWHEGRSDDFRSPITKAMRRVNARESVRERTLNDDEIRRVWKAADALDGPAGPFVQFLLLTAARRSEAAGLRFAELSGSDWLLPAARNKVGVDLLRPLSAAALEAIAKAPRISDELVFSTGTRPLDGFSRFKRTLDATSGVSGWTLHDLRRTSRSLMSRAGVPVDHAERTLGHVIGGVRGTYDKHRYYAEMRRAVDQLAALIERIVNGPVDNVVAMRS